MRALTNDEVAMVSGGSIDPEITVVINLGGSLFGLGGGIGAGGFEFPSVSAIDLLGLPQYGAPVSETLTATASQADADADGIPDDAIIVSAARYEDITVGIPDFASGGANYFTVSVPIPALIDCNLDGKPDLQKAMDGKLYALDANGNPLGRVVGPITITQNSPGTSAEGSVSITGPLPGANASVTYTGATTTCSYQFVPF